MRRNARFIAMAAGLALFAAACGGDDDAADTETTEATEAAETTEATEAPETEMEEPTATETMATEMEEPTADDTAMEDGGTIVDVAAGADDFSTLVAAVQAAGLAETLSGEGPFTVFAPTDEAFEAALESLDLTADELLADEALLTDVLTYHVVEGEVPASDVMGLDGQEVTTVNGAPVTVTVDGDTVMVNDATVVTTDIMASNGIIHAIDGVLLPPEE
jgi:uncharacterized surface protein with fasciclin (FAS1) repeats